MATAKRKTDSKVKPAKRKTDSKVKLPAKKRKELVATVQKEDYEDVAEEAVRSLAKSLQFQHFQRRKLFMQYFTDEPQRSLLLECVRNMQHVYKKLLKKHCTGKHYLEMQQSWFMHISIYFDASTGSESNVDGLDASDTVKLQGAWKMVMDKAIELECALSLEDQRLIVSTLAYIVYDMMCDKVKEKKEKKSQLEAETVEFHESTVSLYRYAGAALHSMMEKRKKLSLKHKELKLLHAMQIKKEELDVIPSQVQYLTDGGLVIVSPVIIPFIQELMIEINENINSEKLKLHGKNMIKVALEKIEAIDRLKISFKTCITKVGTVEEVALDDIEAEMMKKIFHARVNEFFEARKEINLEKKGLITDADQSLRDALKTYSIKKSRP